MVKVRISLTIDKNILELVDRTVDNINIRSRSHAVETLMKSSLNKEKSVVLLCGGKEFTLKNTDTLRPLALLKTKTIIERIIDKCKSYGFQKFYIIGPKRNLNRIYPITNKIRNVEIRYLEEKKSFGSAKALLPLKREIRSTFLVIPSDTVFDFDLNDMLEFHKKNESIITLALNILKKPGEAHYKLGKVIMKGNKVVSYVDKSEEETMQVISTFIFFAEPTIFNHLKGKTKSLQKDLFPTFAQKNILSGYPFQGYWFNVHNKRNLIQAKKAMQKTKFV